jgi:hypothetical protein
MMTASAAVTSYLDDRVILHRLLRQWCDSQPSGRRSGQNQNDRRNRPGNPR